MINKNLYRLEFDKVLDILASYCITQSGKKLALNLEPSGNEELVNKNLLETSLGFDLLIKKGNAPISDIANIEIFIKNLKSGNYLSAKGLLDIAIILKISRLLKEYFFDDKSFDLSNFAYLEEVFNNLYTNETIENNIFSSIIDENTIDDNASSTLASLRKNRRKLEEDVRTKLSNFVHSSSYAKYLMDSIITIRNDRFVIPVKDEYKSQIKGSILDVSSSGSTVYIEPAAIYELNNKINSIKIEESLEIEKILNKLSSLLMPIAENLENNYNLIAKIDFVFAKAKFSKSINGVCPNINSEKFVDLKSARHPLIDPNKVVPIDLSIGKDYKTLVVTGPNTGGKTATLKTCGLLIAMACSGLHIPAKEGSSIYVFDNIFADIGDEQSIEESLSTFSSHIVNIIDILNCATKDSLILLDELGSGTDPVEGASLAISILEHFQKKGSLTIATTHYPELKNYALVTNGFENASSDFDVINLKPTYKLLIGVPGKSNAFAISKNLGLPQNILDRANDYLKEDSINIETLLKNIYDDKLEIEKQKEEIEKNLNQIELLRKSLERDNSKLNQEAENIISDAKQKARELLLDAKEEANDIIRELSSSKIDLKQANNLRNKLNTDLNKINEAKTNSYENFKELDINNISIGQNVLIKKLNKEAIVTSLPNKKGELQVRTGIISMNVNVKDLAQSNSSNVIKSSKANLSVKTNSKAQNVAHELNIIGLNVDEAIPIVDKYLDDAYLAKLASVRIVHGKGTGRLRTRNTQFFKNTFSCKNI